MINITDFEITYMGRNCTISDTIKYGKEPNKCKQLEKIGAIVYINSGMNQIKMTKKEMSFDKILEYLISDIDMCNFLAIKVIKDFKIKEVPKYLKTIFESEDVDEKYDLFVNFLKDCGIY